MTVAIAAGQRIDYGDRASTSCSTLEPAETRAAVAEAETSSRPRRPVIESMSSEEEEEEEMQRRRPRVMVADLATRVFGDRAPRVLLPADAAPAAALGSTSTTAADATTPAAAPAPTSSPSTRVREHQVETSREEGQPEKRPRIEASPNPLGLPSSSVAASFQPARSAPWRPDLQVEPGRPLTVEDSVANDAYVVIALGRACALPRDKEKLKRMDDVTLTVSTMQSTI